MKTKIFVFSLALCLLALPVLAQNTTSTEKDLPKAGWTPSHPLYLLEKWVEKIDLWLTLDAQKRIEKLLQYADERVSEAEAVIEDTRENVKKRQKEFLDEAFRLREEYQNRAQERLEKAEKKKEVAQDRLNQLKEKATEQYLRHREVLEDVLEQVPEQAKESVERVIQSSKERFDQRLEALDNKGEALEQRLENRIENVERLQDKRVDELQAEIRKLERRIKSESTQSAEEAKQRLQRRLEINKSAK